MATSEDAFFEGDMSAKFSKLKETDGGTTFSRTKTRLDEQSEKSLAQQINLAPGATIGGVYDILKLIGRGGMGEVYLAQHKTLLRKCALKVIPPDEVTEESWKRFRQEAKSVANLDHANLVKVTDLGVHEGCLPYYAMDFVEGKNLADLLAARGPLPIAMVLEIFKQVCDGLQCAHENGILHRDLKPANIMILTAGTGRISAKVLDFGLAKLTKQDRAEQSLTNVGDVFGSPFYMSPEQCNGSDLDCRSDIYSLGCTMFEMLTGRPPFDGHIVSSIFFGHLEAPPPSLESVAGAGKFPKALELVLAKALCKLPAERYQSMAQLKADLERLSAVSRSAPESRPVESTSTKEKDATLTAAQTQSKTPTTDPTSTPLPAVGARSSTIPLALGVVLLGILIGVTVYFASLPESKESIPPEVLRPPKAEPTEYKSADDSISQEMDKHLAIAAYRNGKRQGNIVKSSVGSENFFDNGLNAADENHFSDAIKNFTQVLSMIPLEEKDVDAWHVAGIIANKRLFMALTYEQRSYCYLKLKQYNLAIADLSMAIRLRPDYAANYSNRAKAYYLLGKRDLGDADMEAAAQVSHPDRLLDPSR